jgi:hypothetical protein
MAAYWTFFPPPCNRLRQSKPQREAGRCKAHLVRLVLIAADLSYLPCLPYYPALQALLSSRFKVANVLMWTHVTDVCDSKM